MGPRKPSRVFVLAGALALAGMPLFFAFARPGDGLPFQDLQRKIDALSERVATLEAARHAQDDRVAALEASQHEQDARIAVLESLLVHFSRDGNDVTISGANLHVDNGTGRTDVANGLGNVIVGYNESRSTSPACRIFPSQCQDERLGSHMLVAGRYQNYTSYGGLVVGSLNSVSGPFSSVCGGRDNVASGDHSAIGGGSSNEARGNDSMVAGGSGNSATGLSASVCGGAYNAASGIESAVAGGALNDASGIDATVCGGTHNEASGEISAISGGTFNEAHGRVTSIGGGTRRFLSTPYAWQAGDLIRIDGPP